MWWTWRAGSPATGLCRHGMPAPVELFIPAKGGPQGKTRLASLLGPDQRARLVFALAKGTFEAVAAAGCFTAVTVITNDENIAEFALARGWRIQMDGGTDLNAALSPVDGGAAERMILPIDLPYLDFASLRRQVLERSDGLTIGQSARDHGTTFLLGPIGRLDQLAFGVPASSLVHAQYAAARSIPAMIATATPLTQDLDTAEDFLALTPARCMTPLAALLRDFPALSRR